MTALSINLPDDLAKASQEAAHRLGMSRSNFIRMAILHELQKLQAKLEEEAMAKSMVAMENSAQYMKEAEEIDAYLNTSLPDEKEQWWKK